MKDQILNLLKLKLPLPKKLTDLRANCFNAVQLYWDDCSECKFVGAEDFVAYMQKAFKQIEPIQYNDGGDVTIVWSRSSDVLPIGSIRIDDLRKERPGYPFGLIIEHAFVSLDGNKVFQKRDPSEMGPYELITRDAAIAPYLSRFGFELTFHRRL